jgi:leader peptidase (prepilin peptidase) / N-methyltransferase
MIYGLVFVVGILIGSFLNVCIYRIPREEDIVYTPSHCMHCKKPIPWYDLFPLVSWILLRGQCRYCKAKLSIQYPLIELINGVAYVALLGIFGLNFQMGVLCFLFSALLVISLIDLRYQIIPNGIVIFLVCLGVADIVLNKPVLTDRMIGFFAVSIPLLIIHIITNGNMGMGDVKLMAACGLILGWQQILLALMIGSILGSVVGLTLIALKVMSRKQQIPFGPYLSMGILIAAVFGKEIINGYMLLLL